MTLMILGIIWSLGKFLAMLAINIVGTFTILAWIYRKAKRSNKSY